jgi:hypothetical protein
VYYAAVALHNLAAAGEPQAEKVASAHGALGALGALLQGGSSATLKETAAAALGTIGAYSEALALEVAGVGGVLDALVSVLGPQHPASLQTIAAAALGSMASVGRAAQQQVNATDGIHERFVGLLRAGAEAVREQASPSNASNAGGEGSDGESDAGGDGTEQQAALQEAAVVAGQACWALIRLIEGEERVKDSIADIPGALSSLLILMTYQKVPAVPRWAGWAVANLVCGSSQLTTRLADTTRSLEILAVVLRHAEHYLGDGVQEPAVMQPAALLLASVACIDQVELQRRLVATPGALEALAGLLLWSSWPQMQMMSCAGLRNIASCGHELRMEVSETAGVMPRLQKLAAPGYEDDDEGPYAEVRERAGEALEVLSERRGLSGLLAKVCQVGSSRHSISGRHSASGRHSSSGRR